MKVHFGILAFVALLAFVAAKDEPSHNVNFGKRSERDQHLQREVVYEKSKFLRKLSGDYVFQQKNTPFPKIITQVVVTDQYTNGKGGYATLTSGGPGFPELKLHFSSQRGHGYNFVIDIYGQ